MLAWIIQITIISIIFIFVVHYLISFFKNTLTVPKIKDLVNSPSQKYQNIFDTISNNSNNKRNSYTTIDLLPNETIGNANSMKDELKSFLKKQLNTSENDSNVIGLDSLTGGFASF